MLPVPPPREPYDRLPGLTMAAALLILLIAAVAVIAFALGPHPQFLSTYNCPVPDQHGNLPSGAHEDCRP